MANNLKSDDNLSYRYIETDDKIQIFSVVKNVGFLVPGEGTAHNFMAEVANRQEASELLKRLGVPACKRPPK